MADKETDALGRLEMAAERIVGRAEYEQANRRGLLWVHAAVALVASTQMLLYGTAGTIEALLGTWTRALMFAIGTAGALMLIVGLSWRPRSLPLEVGGLSIIATWDLIMGAAFCYIRFHQHMWSPLGFHTAQPPGYATAYPTTIYLGLFALVSIHVVTLFRILRTRKGLAL